MLPESVIGKPDEGLFQHTEILLVRVQSLDLPLDSPAVKRKNIDSITLQIDAGALILAAQVAQQGFQIEFPRQGITPLFRQVKQGSGAKRNVVIRPAVPRVLPEGHAPIGGLVHRQRGELRVDPIALPQHPVVEDVGEELAGALFQTIVGIALEEADRFDQRGGQGRVQRDMQAVLGITEEFFRHDQSLLDAAFSLPHDGKGLLYNTFRNRYRGFQPLLQHFAVDGKTQGRLSRPHRGQLEGDLPRFPRL